jgi:hypothetical protein
MTLAICPECHADVSDQAAQCPQCGYPLAVRSPTPAPVDDSDLSGVRTVISRRFAVGWTTATGSAVLLMFVLGRSVPGVAAATWVGALGLLASSIPIWWKTRRVAGGGAPAPAELERRVEERLQAGEERIRRWLAEMEDGSRHVMELEERVDFAERLLTKYRDEQLRNPPPSGSS